MARRPSVEQDAVDEGPDGQRLDKWLWFARVAKTRTLAAGLVADGRVRVNRQRVTKPAQVVRVGDVITVSVARGVRVLRIEAAGARRGPPSEAQALYEEIVPLPGSGRSGAGPAPDAAKASVPVAAPPEGEDAEVAVPVPLPVGRGRPTKRERRMLDRLKARFDEP